MDERLQDTLQIWCNLGGQYPGHVQGTTQSDWQFKEAGECKLKGVGKPKYYLGANLNQRKVDNYTCYKTHAKTYITHIMDKIEKPMEWSLKSNMSMEDPNYSPELDKTPLLGPEKHSQYRMIIGSLNWLVTLGCYTIYHAASTTAQYRMAPQEGHLHATKHILGFLWAYQKISFCYNTRIPDISMYKTQTYNCFCSYPEAQETLPHNIPWTTWATSQALGLLWRTPCKLAQDMTLGDRHPTFYQQLSHPLVLQMPEHSCMCILNIIHCHSETNLSNLLIKPLGSQVFQHFVKYEQFLLQLQDEGELNGETVKKTNMDDWSYPIPNPIGKLWKY